MPCHRNIVIGQILDIIQCIFLPFCIRHSEPDRIIDPFILSARPLEYYDSMAGIIRIIKAQRRNRVVFIHNVQTVQIRIVFDLAYDSRPFLSSRIVKRLSRILKLLQRFFVKLLEQVFHAVIRAEEHPGCIRHIVCKVGKLLEQHELFICKIHDHFLRQ